MANSNESEKNLEVIDKSLEFMAKALDIEKDNLKVTEKVMEEKDNEIEETKLYLESNKRTVDALKRTLEMIKKSTDSGFEGLDGVENSLETLKTTIEGEEEIVRNGVETVKGEIHFKDTKAETAVTIDYVDRAVCLSGIEITTKAKQDVGQTVVTDVFKKPLCSVIKNVEKEGKSHKTIDKSEQKCLENCNHSGKMKTKENISGFPSPIVVPFSCEKNTEDSYLTNEKLVRPEEKSKISNESNEEFELAEEKSVLPEEKQKISNEDFGLAKEKSEQPTENQTISNLDFELLKETSARSKDREVAYGKTVLSKEESQIYNGPKRDEDKSVRPEGLSRESEEIFNRVWEKYVLSNENSDLINEKSTENSSLVDSPHLKVKHLDTDKYCETNSRNNKPGMDNPFNAMLFSEQLIEYVLREKGHIWVCQEGARNLPTRSVTPIFSKMIGETIMAIIESNIENVTKSYRKLVEQDVHEMKAYRREVFNTALQFFCNVFNPRDFLVYAAQLAGLSALYFADGNKEIADASAQVLAHILNCHIYQRLFIPGRDWFNLHLAAQELKSEIEDHKIIFVMPDESSNSA